MPALPATAICFLLLMFVSGCGQQQPPEKPLQLHDVQVEVACGQCQFNQPGTGCDLAIRHAGQVWFVVGSSIDDHGDAHAEEGLCNAIRSGLVTGTLLDNGKFQVETLKLLPATGNQ